MPDLIAPAVPLVVEVKNLRGWIYPYSQELWELLVKAADIASTTPVMPVLVCVHTAWPTGQMARDIGFLAVQLRDQLFSPDVPIDEFTDIINEFGLSAVRHQGPSEAVVAFLTKVLRLSPPPPPPPDEDIPWYLRQVERFRAPAPVIINHQSLAEDILGSSRRGIFNMFRRDALDAMTWQSARGW